MILQSCNNVTFPAKNPLITISARNSKRNQCCKKYTYNYIFRSVQTKIVWLAKVWHLQQLLGWKHEYKLQFPLTPSAFFGLQAPCLKSGLAILQPKDSPLLQTLSIGPIWCLHFVEGILKRYPDIGDGPRRFYRTFQKILLNPQQVLSNSERYNRTPIWPLKTFLCIYKAVVKGPSKPQRGFYRTVGIELPFSGKPLKIVPLLANQEFKL